MPRTLGAKKGKFGNSIDKATFEKLCSILCTEDEICGFFKVSDDTLRRWCLQEYSLHFKEVWTQLSSLGKISLRRIQFKQAESNPTMAIFLGKQYLGQSDVVQNNNVDQVQIMNDVPKERGE